MAMSLGDYSAVSNSYQNAVNSGFNIGNAYGDFNNSSFTGEYTSPVSSNFGVTFNPTGLINGLVNSGMNAAGFGMNYAFNKEQFEYQKDLQERLIELSLNAMQNKMKDYTAAGFSPLAALEGSAGNNLPTVANTAQYQSLGEYLSRMGDSFTRNNLDFTRLSLDSKIALDNAMIERDKISCTQYIAKMQNDTKLRELYYNNKQFYDGLNQAQKQFETQLEQASTIADAEMASREYIARCDRTMQYNIAKMQDKTKRAELTKRWNMMVAEMRFEASQAKKDRDLTKAQNRLNRLTSLATGAMNAFTNYSIAGVTRRSVSRVFTTVD